MKETMTELKALVGKKRDRYSEVPTLYVNTDNESRVWATNKYWLVNAERMRPLFDHFNLPIETGRYEVNGKVVQIPGDAPNVNGLMPSSEWTRRLVHEQIGGRDAYVHGHDDRTCPYMAVLADSDGGQPIYVNALYLAFVIGDAGKVTFRQPKPTMPVAVYDDELFKTGTSDGKTVTVPATGDLLGLVMPIRA